MGVIPSPNAAGDPAGWALLDPFLAPVPTHPLP